MASQMRWPALILILLLLSAKVDNAWAVAPDVPTAPLTDDDDDDYLPSQRRPEEAESSPHHKPVFLGPKSEATGRPSARRGGPPGRGLTTPFAPRPLYVFMSLRI
jgi:hypothetical protein